MVLPKFLRPKYLLKYLWFGFGLMGTGILIKQYLPQLLPQVEDSDLVKGVQSELVQTIDNHDSSSGLGGSQLDFQELKNLPPQQAAQVVSQVVSQQITQLVQETTTEIKHLPAQQIRKIKIGACEDLLEEDICSVASELQCSPDQ